jgi:hypothetical protein
MLAASASTFVPLFNHLVVMPYLYHPTRWGGIPWYEPSAMMSGFMHMLLNIIVLSLIGTFSSMMSTLGACNKSNLTISLKRSIWLVLGYLVGTSVISIMPFLKAPMLSIGNLFPYANWIVHGFLVSFFVLIFGAIGNKVARGNVCELPRPHGGT